MFTLDSKTEVSEFDRLAIFLHKLDIENQDYAAIGVSRDKSFQTLDASLAANIIQARLKTIEGEINDLDEMHGSEEAKDRKHMCYVIRYKLQEALVRLYSMLNEYSKAVKLALATNMLLEAQKLANRARN